MRKRIAVLAAQIDEATQKKFLSGFVPEAYACNYDICIFTMLQKYQETPARNIGDSNIYELINYDLFDAIVVLADTILTPGLVPVLLRKIKDRFNGPVLLVDYDSDLFDSIQQDHYTPVRKIVDHMIEVHGYTNLAFLGGKEGHPHSIQRLNAFRDSLNAHDVPVNEELIYHGNFWYDGGEDFAKFLLTNRDKLPRAIVCANDIMAIGLASMLTENGIRIPEDVAITGYDSIDMGRTSPHPLTSASIPSFESGRYCAKWIDAKLEGTPIPKYECDPPIFIGSSCGCEYSEPVKPTHRDVWRTQQSAKSMFSDFNHMLEDLMSENKVYNFFTMLSKYTYQIKPFHSFDICCNDFYMSPDAFVGEKSLRKGYTSTMNRVLSCVEASAVVDLKGNFKTADLFPDLYLERDYPTTFIFSPLYSDDRCFGYTVINYGSSTEFYDEGFKVWMRDIMSGMEAFYRQRYMMSLVNKLQANQVRDSLTGLYNYTGFLKNINSYFFAPGIVDSNISIAALDIKGIHQINEVYGRETGERAINALAHFITNNTREHEFSCRMSNDEFLIALNDDMNSTRTNEIIRNISEAISSYKLVSDSEYQLMFHHTNLVGNPSTTQELELMANQVTSIKNHKKASTSNKNGKTSDLVDEIKRNQIVMDILNKNLLTYHYQPIINLADGSVFAYEALMRSRVDNISPLQIIDSAKYLNRLNDIEKYTLMNVTADVLSKLSVFGNAKVFVNSLPGIDIPQEDQKIFLERMRANKGRFVIEFTEESQLDEIRYSEFKKMLSEVGSELAIDDYGAGYSNTGNMLKYMPHYVKIDRSLISEIHKSPQKKHLVRGITDFAHTNNILVLAEGIETELELQTCIEFGIDLAQGFYLGRPQREPMQMLPNNLKLQIDEFRTHNLWHIV